jgi:hypothetical protein
MIIREKRELRVSDSLQSRCLHSTQPWNKKRRHLCAEPTHVGIHTIWAPAPTTTVLCVAQSGAGTWSYGGNSHWQQNYKAVEGNIFFIHTSLEQVTESSSQYKTFCNICSIQCGAQSPTSGPKKAISIYKCSIKYHQELQICEAQNALEKDTNPLANWQCSGGFSPPSGLEIKLWVLPITLPEILIHHAVHDQKQITAETRVELPWWSNTSDAEPFGSQALQVGFDELSAGTLAILHDAVVSQLLCIWASTADLLFWLRLRCRSCCGRLLHWI